LTNWAKEMQGKMRGENGQRNTHSKLGNQGGERPEDREKIKEKDHTKEKMTDKRRVSQFVRTGYCKGMGKNTAKGGMTKQNIRNPGKRGENRRKKGSRKEGSETAGWTSRKDKWETEVRGGT